MKKVLALVLVAAVVMFAGIAFAASAQNNTGCGLGAVVFKNGQADDSTLLQLVMTTLNGLCGNQTFGITTGTLECKKPSKIASNEKLNEFVVANMDNLAKDIAKGSGETLDTLAELMNISAPERAKFYAKLQSNFDKIFTSEKVELSDVVDNIAAVSAQI